MADGFDKIQKLANGRKIVIWGAGNDGVSFIDFYKDNISNIEFVIDKDLKKENTLISGVKVLHPSSVKEWDKLFIVVTSSKCEYAIINDLISKGCKGDADYISWNSFYKEIQLESISLNEVIDCLRDLEPEKKEFIVRNEFEYLDAKIIIDKQNRYRNVLSKILCNHGGFNGFCSCCGNNVRFKTYSRFFKNSDISYRETFACPVCRMNSRMRQVYDYIKLFGKSISVYAYEYITNSFKAYEQYFDNIIGSEYIGDECNSGEKYDGILHEDAMHLSFDNNSFDLMISCDVFEHVPSYEKAFKEAYRCLKKSGQLVFTVPFYPGNKETITRAKIEDGKVVHLLPPEYHGNPMSEEGSLCFHNFGWNLIDCIRKIGFSDVYAIYQFDLNSAYLSDAPIFVAVK